MAQNTAGIALGNGESVSSGSGRPNTRMPADVHVIPACHGSTASTDFPLFALHRCSHTGLLLAIYVHQFHGKSTVFPFSLDGKNSEQRTGPTRSWFSPRIDKYDRTRTRTFILSNEEDPNELTTNGCTRRELYIVVNIWIYKWFTFLSRTIRTNREYLILTIVTGVYEYR